MSIKKITALLLCIVVMSTFVITAGAVSEKNGFLYEKIESSSLAEVVGISDTGILADSTEITVPPTLNALSVIQISKSAFANNKTIKKINLSDNLLEISDNAMYGMKSLEEVTLPKNLTVLGEYVFGYCTSLKKVNFNTIKLSEISSKCFYGCSNLENIIIPNSVFEICDYCFGNCPSLTRIYIPDSVSLISETAFYGTNNNLTIYGMRNSNAHYYALRHNIHFVAMDGKCSDELDKIIYDVKYKLFESGTVSYYTQESINKLNDCYEKAVSVQSNFFSTPAEAETVKDELRNCYYSLELISMSELKELILQCETYLVNSYMYDEDTIEHLNNVTVSAKKTADKVLPTQWETEYNINILKKEISQLKKLAKGDVNRDEAITLSDAVMIQKYIIGISDLNERQFYISDYNDDGKVSIADVILVQRYILNN